MLSDLHALIAILRDAQGEIAFPKRGWSLATIAGMLGTGDGALAREIRRACGIASQPESVRIDHLLSELSAQGLTPPGGWSSSSIAILADVSHTAIRARLAYALHCARAAAKTRGLMLSDIEA